jgi:hypothetical protein
MKLGGDLAKAHAFGGMTFDGPVPPEDARRASVRQVFAGAWSTGAHSRGWAWYSRPYSLNPAVTRSTVGDRPYSQRSEALTVVPVPLFQIPHTLEA